MIFRAPQPSGFIEQFPSAECRGVQWITLVVRKQGESAGGGHLDDRGLIVAEHSEHRFHLLLRKRAGNSAGLQRAGRRGDQRRNRSFAAVSDGADIDIGCRLVRGELPPRWRERPRRRSANRGICRGR